MGNSIKLFISYSWTNQDHETWVLNLANVLSLKPEPDNTALQRLPYVL